MEELPKINWVKNDPKKHKWFVDGSKFLVALKVNNRKTGKTNWDFDVVCINADGEHMFLETENGDSYDSWLWEDFEYFHLLGGEMPKEEL